MLNIWYWGSSTLKLKINPPFLNIPLWIFHFCFFFYNKNYTSNSIEWVDQLKNPRFLFNLLFTLRQANWHLHKSSTFKNPHNVIYSFKLLPVITQKGALHTLPNPWSIQPRQTRLEVKFSNKNEIWLELFESAVVIPVINGSVTTL